MFILKDKSELTTDKLKEFIQQFNTVDRVNLQKYYDYYKGNQKISKKITDKNKPNNKITTNYCYNITQNYLGYLTGIPVAYNSEADISDILDILNYNDIKTEDSELLRNALIYGKSYELLYIDEDKKQRIKTLDSREIFNIYANTLDATILYSIRIYTNDIKNIDYMIEVYDDSSVITYKTTNEFSSFEFVSRTEHYYGQVPVIEFNLNSEKESIFDKIMTLQDSYNTLLSSEVDDFESFCNAYLVVRNLQVDEDDLAEMQKKRILLLDADSTAEYLTKSISDTQIENMLKNINNNIHKIAQSPDFNDEKFMAQSGIAMKFKLCGFENVSSAIESNMKKALQKRIELIMQIINITDECVWRDIHIIFTRNLPQNNLEIASMINTLRGLVSDKTLLSLLPFVSDVDAELDALEKQKADNASLYGFTVNTDNAEQDEKVGE